MNIHITSTLIILVSSEIILIYLCFDKNIYKLVLTGYSSYSSKSLIFYGDI